MRNHLSYEGHTYGRNNGGWFNLTQQQNPFSKLNYHGTIGALGSVAGQLGHSLIGDGYDADGVGNGIANIGGSIGGAISTVNPLVGGIVSAASGIVGGLTNRAFGTKENKANINAIEQNTTNMNQVGNVLAGVGDSDSFFKMAGSMGSSSGFNTGDLVKGGWFSKGKARRKAQKYLNAENSALAFQNHGMALGAQGVDSNQDDDVMAHFSAYGGPLNMINNDNMGAIEYGLAADYIAAKNRKNEIDDKMPGMVGLPALNTFSEGGGIHINPKNRGKFNATKKRTGKTTEELTHSKNPLTRKRAIFAQNAKKWKHALGGDLQTHGSDWGDGMITIGAGLSHELNPYEGVQMGTDSQGTPNLVEEGEVVWNDYVFSNRIPVDEGTKAKFHIGKKKEMTYADLAKKLEKEITERPNDPISKAGFNAQMEQLEAEQERQKAEMEAEKAREAFASLSPEEQTAVMQQVAKQEQMAQEQAVQEQAMQEQAMQQPTPEDIAMAQQQADGSVASLGQEVPMMAEGGKIYSPGGPLNTTYNAGFIPEVVITPEQNIRVSEELTPFDVWGMLQTKKQQDILNDYLEELRKDRKNKKGKTQIHYYPDGGEIGSPDDPPTGEDPIDYSHTRPDSTWHRNWLTARQPILQQNMKDAGMPGRSTDGEINRQIGNMENVSEITPSRDPFGSYPVVGGVTRSVNTDGERIPYEIEYYYASPSEAVKAHERTHAMVATPQEEAIDKIDNELQHKDIVQRKEYRGDSSEKYAHLMEMRRGLNLSPDYIVTPEDVHKWRMEDILPNFFDDLDDAGLARMFNEVAYNPVDNNISNVNMAADGGELNTQKVNKYPDGGTFDDWWNTYITNSKKFGVDPLSIDYGRLFESIAGTKGPTKSNEVRSSLESLYGVSPELFRNYDIKNYRFIDPEKVIAGTSHGINANNQLPDVVVQSQRIVPPIPTLQPNAVVPERGEASPSSSIPSGSYDNEHQKAVRSRRGKVTFTEPSSINGFVSNAVDNPKAVLPQTAVELAKITPPTEPVYPQPEPFVRSTPPEGIGPNPNWSDEPEPDLSKKPVERKLAPVLKAEWPRYAGLFGPAVGLGMMAAGVGRPDYSALDAAVRMGTGDIRLADYKPLGDYLTYRPMDIWAEQNRLDANARATDRAIRNSGLPTATKNASLLANAYNNQIASSELYKKALEYNDAKEAQVKGFNRGTNQFNAEAYNRNSQFNANAMNRAKQYQANLALNAAAQKMDAEAGWYNSLYGNVSGLFKGIGDLGRENAERNMLARLATAGAFGTITPENAVNAGLMKWVGKNGGKIQRGKKGRRGLTY